MDDEHEEYDQDAHKSYVLKTIGISLALMGYTLLWMVFGNLEMTGIFSHLIRAQFVIGVIAVILGTHRYFSISSEENQPQVD